MNSQMKSETPASSAITQKFKRSDLLPKSPAITPVSSANSAKSGYPIPTAKEVSDTINNVKDEAMNTLKDSVRRFKALAENSPMEGPVTGFNRHLKHMSPTTRDMVLQSRMPDIMAFAEDRSIDPGIVAGIAEASMRMGRIPDLGMYGLAGDEALAVKHFIADNVLNLAEQIVSDEAKMTEDGDTGEGSGMKAKHLKLASDYKKLSDFHKRRAKEESDKAKIAKEDGRTHSAIKANSASEEHKALAQHCMGLADYHQLKANEHPTSDGTKPVDYPTADPHKTPPEPPQDEAKEKAPPMKGPKTESVFGAAASRFRTSMNEQEPEEKAEKPSLATRFAKASGNLVSGVAKTTGNAVAGAGSEILGGVGAGANKLVRGLATGKVDSPYSEATVHGDIPGILDPIGKGAFPERASSVIPMIEREPAKAPYGKRWVGGLDSEGGNKCEKSGHGTTGQGYANESPSDDAEDEADKVKPMESIGKFRSEGLLDDLLMEAKKKKAKAKKKKSTSPKAIKYMMANVKTAPLFHALGHKMDHAETKAMGGKYKPKWSKALHNKCLKGGGSEAADLVLQHGLKNPWVRDMGFTDEASNLHKNWEAAMSDDEHEHASNTSPTALTPISDAVSKIIKMSSK